MRLPRQPVVFVTGKGGVGKSAVACALATHFADRGHPTLLAQVNARDSHGPMLATPPIDGELHVVDQKLSVVNMRPDLALHEYAKIVLRFETVVNALLENRVARAFLRFVPALAELTMLGKIWFHAEEQVSGRPRFARIVVDAPSTGHGLGFLRVARVAHDATGGIGPMAEKTRAMQAVLTDPQRSALHVVTLAEEMPVNETKELVLAARSDALPPLGLCIVNALVEPLFVGGLAEDAKRFVEENRDGTMEGARDVTARRLSRETIEARELKRLADALGDLPRIRVPLIDDTRDPVAFLAAFRSALFAALAEEERA